MASTNAVTAAKKLIVSLLQEELRKSNRALSALRVDIAVERSSLNARQQEMERNNDLGWGLSEEPLKLKEERLNLLQLHEDSLQLALSIAIDRFIDESA
jgi:hypothetical protein